MAAVSDLVERHGCSACHHLEGEGPALPLATGGKHPPILDGIGARLRAEWVFDFLGAPEKSKVRPWLPTRMPSFEFDDRERNILAAYFSQADGRPLLTGEPPKADKDSLLLGKIVYRLLQCGRCHGGEGEAPSYGLAKERLRHTWVVQWILDPAQHGPESAMPAFFLPGGEEYDSTYLVGMLGTPIFSDLRAQLHRGLGSSAETKLRLSQPELVAEALRDYLWSLEP
jgi:mono/diheme cytochrome c family protein